MIDHTGIGVADMARSAAFYDAALSALGLRLAPKLNALIDFLRFRPRSTKRPAPVHGAGG
jgi:catechol 2,3-dioxygenase-like lactoylglutathione lyase family enzyme